ncbi:MAG TPA: host attachment protein [Methylophilaceae bacterium]|nr:host attachment protein [Methylophilaceae bacterium]
MEATWIVVADAARGRIFEMQQEGHLAEIENFVNPAEREDNADLRTDGYGRFYGKGEREEGHTAEPSVLPKEHEAARFAKHLAVYLDQARNRHLYDKLRLIAAPSFLGLLRNTLDDEVRKLVDQELDQDLTKVSVRELEQRLERTSH